MTSGIQPTELSEDTLSHLYKVFHGDLRLCDCGEPATAYELVRDILALCPLYEDEHWRTAADLVGHPGAYHFTLSWLNNADLVEHGGTLGGCWITSKGRWVLAMLRDIDMDDLDDQFECLGPPHYRAGTYGECSDACWHVPSTVGDMGVPPGQNRHGGTPIGDGQPGSGQPSKTT